MTSTSRELNLFLVALLLVTALTWIAGLYVDQFDHGTEIGFVDGFPGDLDQWERAGGWDNILIEDQHIGIRLDDGKASFAIRKFDIPNLEDKAHQHLRIRGLVETVTRVERQDDDRGAAFMLWLLDDTDEVLKYLIVQNLTGDFPEYRAERVVPLPVEATRFATVLATREHPGAYNLLDVSAELVEAQPVYRYLNFGVLLMWAGLLLLVSAWLMRRTTLKMALVASLLFACILAGVLLPDSVTTGVILPLYRKAMAVLSITNDKPLNYIYKTGHFLFFFLTALLLLLNRKHLQMSTIYIITALGLFALATEGLQLHLFNRNTQIADVMIDLAGVALAWPIAFIAERFQPSEPITAHIDLD